MVLVNQGLPKPTQIPAKLVSQGSNRIHKSQLGNYTQTHDQATIKSKRHNERSAQLTTKGDTSRQPRSLCISPIEASISLTSEGDGAGAPKHPIIEAATWSILLFFVCLGKYHCFLSQR